MTTDKHHDHLATEDRALARSLDALGATNRATPDHDFEQRLMDALTPALTPSPIPIGTAPRRTSWRPIFAAAACVLLATAAAVIFAPTSARTGQPGASQTLVALEEDLSAFEELGSLSDSLDISLAELDVLTDAMDTELAHPSVFVELNASTSPTGSL